VKKPLNMIVKAKTLKMMKSSFSLLIVMISCLSLKQKDKKEKCTLLPRLLHQSINNLKSRFKE